MAGTPEAGLRETLSKVRGRITQHRERGEHIGEQNTKATLIDPVLAALGWRLDELDDVQREYKPKGQDNPVDYALFVFDKPCLLVEAKALGAVLDRKCVSQVLYYAYVAGIAWCLLTNGDEYRIYCSRETGAVRGIEEKLFRSIRLTDEAGAHGCLETLELIAKDRMGGPPPDLDSLWRSEVVDRRVREAIEESLSGDGFLEVIREKVPDIGASDLRESLGRATVSLRPLRVSPPSSVAGEGQGPGSTTRRSARIAVGIAALVSEGLIDAPLALEKTYRGVTLNATIESDGTVTCLGKRCQSPSAAGGEALRAARGDPVGKAPACDGWVFWQYHEPKTGRLRPLDDLRQQYLRRKT
jgi:hypothetical protein